MTTKAKILKTIRENCINCVVGAISIIDDCGGEKTCVLYPYRHGRDPSPSRKGNLSNLQTAKKSQSCGEKKKPISE